MTVDGCARTCMCVCGEGIMLGTHTHAQCSAQRQRENSCGAAGERCSLHQSLLSTGRATLELHVSRVKNIEGAREFTTFSLYCLTVGQSWDASVKVLLGGDAVVHMYGCQIVPVILCPRYLESFPCARTVRSEGVKAPSGDTEVLFYIDYSSFSRSSIQAVIFVLVVFIL